MAIVVLHHVVAIKIVDIEVAAVATPPGRVVVGFVVLHRTGLAVPFPQADGRRIAATRRALARIVHHVVLEPTSCTVEFSTVTLVFNA